MYGDRHAPYSSRASLCTVVPLIWSSTTAVAEQDLAIRFLANTKTSRIHFHNKK